jgi:hypothetical protein
MGPRGNVIERFAAAGVPAENISFARDTFTFNFPKCRRRSWMNSEILRADHERVRSRGKKAKQLSYRKN